jgi:hypothetical protein
MIGELELDVRINLGELSAEPAVIRGDRRLALPFALKAEKAYERLRFAIVQFRLARVFLKVSEVHNAPSLLKLLV